MRISKKTIKELEDWFKELGIDIEIEDGKLRINYENYFLGEIGIKNLDKSIKVLRRLQYFLNKHNIKTK